MHFLFLAGASLAGAVIALILAVRAFSALRKHGGWRRVAALLVGAGAVSLYVWGVLHVLWAVMWAEDGGTGSSPLGPCREAGEQIAGQAIGYDVGYVWLSFDCRLSDGGTYVTSAVPGYVNPAVALLAVTAVILAVAAGQRAGSYDA